MPEVAAPLVENETVTASSVIWLRVTVNVMELTEFSGMEVLLDSKETVGAFSFSVIVIFTE